ncbi:MAG TPA: polyphenol oxidase family protein [Solirubrobacteraceae bacterium]|jgi:YfiH family protein|nr:polyphenol oxidase family protein [Solirubrobacteraceae bacterium]
MTAQHRPLDPTRKPKSSRITLLPAVLGAEVLELPGSGRAVFTAQAQGNLSSVGGEHAEQGLHARERMRKEIGVRYLARGYQVHGTVVCRVLSTGARLLPAGEPRPKDGPRGSHATPPEADSEPRASSLEADSERRASPLEADSERQPVVEADGHAVAVPGVAAMVLTADCIPVVLGADGAVAALHAGWRGLAAGVLQEGVRAVREVGGKGEVVAIVGPCAGACCYEVGEEVHAAFGGIARKHRNIDLRTIAHERLLSAGVDHVHDLEACTICDERYFSYRREGARAGRQAGLAWLS